MILGIKDDNLLDEVATLDVIESPANDILISDAEPPDPDYTIYVDTQVNTVQQSQAYYGSNRQRFPPCQHQYLSQFLRTCNKILQSGGKKYL